MKLLLNQLSKGIFFLALSAAVISCNNQQKEAELNKVKLENDSLVSTIEYRDSLMNEMIEAFYQIEKDLSIIKEKRNIISTDSENPEIGASQKDRIVKDVQELASMLAKNKKDIAVLRKKLKNSGLKIKNLEKRLTGLNQTLEERNNELLALRDELEQKDYEVNVLNEQIAGLQIEKEMQDTVIASQAAMINNLNKAWYTVGTKKELEEKGVVKKEGGILGLGATRILSPDFQPTYFSEIDVRDTKEILVEADEAKLITEHPSSSYEFVKENDKVAYLAINDVDQFYKFSKYVVLEVK